MKTRYIIYLFCLTSILAGCEKMFVREINFSEQDKKEMLVLSGMFNVYEDTNIYHNTSLSLTHSLFIGKKANLYAALVEDAHVSLRINEVWYDLQNKENQYYSLDDVPLLQPLDEIEIVATHPDYPTASVRQKMPGSIKAKIISWKILPNNWLDIELNFDAYYGNDDDMIAISFTSGYIGGYKLTEIYSGDSVFCKAQNLMAGGYYGATVGKNMYFPATELKQSRTIHIFADRYWTEQELSKPRPVMAMLSLRLAAYTRDAYKYDLSNRLYNEDYNLYAPSGISDVRDYEDDNENIISELLEELQYAFGGQELVPIYRNVDGGLGCVAGMSRLELTLK